MGGTKKPKRIEETETLAAAAMRPSKITDCDRISEILPEYINKTTTPKQNAAIARHMAVCASCRSDFALWLSVSREFEKAAAAAPDPHAMLSKLPRENEKQTVYECAELERICRSGSPNTAFEVLGYVFGMARSAYRLAGLAV
ncbi:MAG: zf-HC2 domain-containing protein [Defluviitaleaceae bacterium]|nr:zf-HC2 domain-containing protein [Defluviitaleaceae bacterium]